MQYRILKNEDQNEMCLCRSYVELFAIKTTLMALGQPVFEAHFEEDFQP